MRNYIIAVSWFICSIISSIANDTMSKYLKLHYFQITFFRFFISSFLLVMFIKFYKQEKLLYDEMPLHIFRGTLLFIATLAWTHGLSLFSLTSATIINFCIPIFVIILSTLCLNESYSWYKWITVLIGIFGSIISIPRNYNFLELEITDFILLLSALIFALLDVINKKIVTKFNISAMILYSSITIAILCFIPTIILWKTPSTLDLLILVLLGLNSNLVLFFLLKAYLLCDISALAPYRYLELILSTIIGYIIFQEIPTLNVFYGGAIIVASTIFIAYLEKKNLYTINHLSPNSDN